MAALLIFTMSAVAFAETNFVDVPEGHWALEALKKVSSPEYGIVEGFPDNTFKGKNTITRYEAAIMIARVIDKVDQKYALLLEKVEAGNGGMVVSPSGNLVLTPEMKVEVSALVSKLAEEFKPELNKMNVRVDALEQKLMALDGRVSAAEVKIAALETKTAAIEERLGNVKFSGDGKFRLRQQINRNASNSGIDKKPFYEAYMELNLNMDIKVSDDVSVFTKLAKLRNNIGANDKDTWNANTKNGRLEKLWFEESVMRMTIKTPKTETVMGNLPDVTFGKLSVYKFSGADGLDVLGALNPTKVDADSEITDVDTQEGVLFNGKFNNFGVTLLVNKFADYAPDNKKLGDGFVVMNENLKDQHYAGMVNTKISDNFAVAGYAGMISHGVTFPEDLATGADKYYGVTGSAKFGKLEVNGEFVGFDPSAYAARGINKDYESSTAYEVGGQFDVFKGFKVAGSLLNIEDVNAYRATFDRLNNRSLNKSVLAAMDASMKDSGKSETGNIFVLAFGTGGQVTSFDADQFDAVKFNLSKDVSLEFKGNVIMARKSDKTSDMTKYPELITKSTLTMPLSVVKNTTLKAIYKLNADKQLTSVNKDEFRLSKSELEVQFNNAFSKNTTITLAGKAENLGVKAPNTEDNLAKDTTIWAEVKVKF